MNYDAFVNKWNGKQVTAYSGECVALVAQYCVENGKPIAYANAKDWWGHPALTGAFDFEANRPTDYNQVPLRGDIIIWDGGLPGSGGYGHIAIYDGKVSPGVFRSFDQNWGGRQTHFVTHTYANVIGWMRPKAAAPAPQGGDKKMTPQEETEAYQIVLERNPDGSATGRTGIAFMRDARAELKIKRDAIAAQQQSMQGTINQLNQTITSITQARDAAVADGSKTKAELVAIMAAEQKQLAELAKLTSDLETAHDTIEDLKKHPVLVHDQETKNMITSIYNYFVGQFKSFAKYIKKG